MIYSVIYLVELTFSFSFFGNKYDMNVKICIKANKMMAQIDVNCLKQI